MASRREVEEARLREGFLNEDHRRAMSFRIQQGAVVALAIAQLRSVHELNRLEPGFSNNAKQEVRVALIGDFVATAEATVAIVSMEDILHGHG